MDTDASVRALAPSSLFGGSRESLPLSVLSSNIDIAGSNPANLHQVRAGGAAERASIYSATGVAPALPSDRNSYYAGKQIVSDGSSVKSGRVGHGRNDSMSGSIGGLGSPLASPREGIVPGKLSRSNSAWGESGDAINEDENVDGEKKAEAEAEAQADAEAKAA